MDPKGANLASTDLLEISQLVSGSYVTKSITGAEIVASIPPTSVEWGDIGGVLSTQIDLQNALNGKQDDITLTTTGTSGASTFVANTLNVPTYSLSGLGGVPTSRTLTINGTTQDLSADRTFTISTGITIGTTAITSGTVGRVLFEGTGNVVSESANMTFDNATGAFQLTTTADNVVGLRLKSTTGQVKFRPYLNSTYGVLIESRNAADSALLPMSLSSNKLLLLDGNVVINSTSDNGAKLQITSGGATSATTSLTITNTSATRLLQIWDDGNIGVNTTTNAGFKVDINGTARVTGNAIVGTSGQYCIGLIGSVSSSKLQAYTNNGLSPIHSITFGYYTTTFDAQDITFNGPVNSKFFGQSTGNWIIGSTTSYASAQFGIDSTTKGFLPPRMTTTQKNAIASPATGLMVYDTTLNLMALYNGTIWTTL